MSSAPGPVAAVVGEALMDVAADGTARPGGSPLNVAVGLSRLGRPTALIARFGGDACAQALRAHAAASGVDLRWSVSTHEPSTTARVHLDVGGGAHYEFVTDGTSDFGWTAAQLHVPPGAALVHFGSLASWLPPGNAAVAARVAALHQENRTLISYDPNVRPALQPDVTAARAAVEAALTRTHLVKVSADDLGYLYPGEPVEQVAARWAAAGPALVVVTDAAGALAVTAGARLRRPARQVAVVDTVGAGDAFTAGLLDALLRLGLTAPRALAAAGPAQLAEALDRAAAVAALTCTRSGADPPTRAELIAAETRPQQS